MPFRITAIIVVATTFLIVLACPIGAAEDRLSVLILDGQNNHDWKSTTPLLKASLESCGRFDVSVATSPGSDGDISEFQPSFADYDVVVSNYNGQVWSQATRSSFHKYMVEGGGFVVVHAANNSFPQWKTYNRLIGLGGWGGRNEQSGPYVYFEDDYRLVRDSSKGAGGDHGPQHEFPIVIREPNHPITKGLPRVWMHTKDELYATLRGPAHHMKVLATAFASPDHRGTGRHEPMLMTIRYEKGRTFHTTLGHADYSMKCVGFVTTLQRGTEWAATGIVTIPVPKDFPGPDQPTVWEGTP